MKSLVLGFLVAASVSLAGETVTVKVSGLVCPLCFSKVESKFKKVDSVKNIKIDMDNKSVILEVKDGQKLTDQDIQQVVDKDSGYKVVEIKRGS